MWKPYDGFWQSMGWRTRTVPSRRPAPPWNWPPRRLGCEPGRIAKSLTSTRGGPVIVVVGTARSTTSKFKDQFGEKASFAKPDELESLVGILWEEYAPLRPCPGVRVFLDESLRLFDPVYPAAGATNNAVEISLADLERVTGAAWVDICKTA